MTVPARHCLTFALSQNTIPRSDCFVLRKKHSAGGQHLPTYTFINRNLRRQESIDKLDRLHKCKTLIATDADHSQLEAFYDELECIVRRES